MTGKPPKSKPVSAPTKPFDPGVERPRPLSSSPSTVAHLPDAHGQELSSFSPDSTAMTPVISVSTSPIFSAIDQFARSPTKNSLENYWIPTPKSLDEAGAPGIMFFKQRQYVAVADGRLVQVIRDAESGLFRVTHASELHPSGPLLRPDSEGRFWLPLENGDWQNRSSSTYSEHSQIAELFLRSGHSVDDFSSLTIKRALATSGVGAMLIHDSPIHPVAMALMTDTLRRFNLDSGIQRFITQMHNPDPSVRWQADPQWQALLSSGEGELVEHDGKRHGALLFERSERAFELDCDENTLQMRRIFPYLPKTIAQALWREASAADHLHLRLRPGMPRHMAEKTLMALREVRVARACEGIYLDSASSLDSDLLALLMIGRLEKWPQEVRIEIHQDMSDGKPLSATGDAGSQVHYTLTRQLEGYVIRGSNIPTPEGPMDLYSAVWRLLQPGQRQLLDVAQGGGVALQRLIRAQPLPSRQSVSKLLGEEPLPVDFISSAALHGQAGQLLGGGDNNRQSTKSAAERVKALYPQLSDEQVTSFVTERLQSAPSAILTRLEKEFATLRNELTIWSADGAVLQSRTAGPENAPPSTVQRQARERFSAKLQDIWQRKSDSRWGEGDDQFSYYVDFPGELPRLSGRFEYVTELLLTANEPGARIGAFLDSFPNIQSLGIFGIQIEEFPSGIFQMRQLTKLTLDGCSLTLSDVTAEGLSRIETLTRLNLANNPLTVAPHVGHMAGLTGLMLSNANLSSLPSGMDALRKLAVVALHDNHISDVGFELFEIPDTQNLFVGLLNNPLSEASRQRINQFLENSSMDRKMEIQTQEEVPDFDFDSESSESGFSTGSDSD